ncbi:hypothetical protein BCR26_02020 [Enterococcus rivorum]|uniref:N-acetyltransferase domain-containing protein n=2 Tax=Enterococcus rivorum TaxID=762845 RepID=A0A1E5KYV6_9ENTE|nr:hypothetical protein BCR26_02020 [Enterococcus rivorum]
MERRGNLKISLADMTKLETVFQNTRETIQQIYPEYYPKGTVAFFLNYHSRERIAEDISYEKVYIIEEKQKCAGTITINNNQIGRLFVLPDYQKQGIGSFLMEFGEKQIFRKYEFASLDSSLPGKKMYIKRGYKVTKSCSLVTGSGDILYYEEMSKMTLKVK